MWSGNETTLHVKLDLRVSSINLQGFFLLIRKSPDFQATKVGRSALCICHYHVLAYIHIHIIDHKGRCEGVAAVELRSYAISWDTKAWNWSGTRLVKCYSVKLELLNKQLECMWAENCHISTTFGAIEDCTHDLMSCKFFLFFPSARWNFLRWNSWYFAGDAEHDIIRVFRVCHCITVMIYTVLGSILPGEVIKFFA